MPPISHGQDAELRDLRASEALPLAAGFPLCAGARPFQRNGVERPEQGRTGNTGGGGPGPRGKRPRRCPHCWFMPAADWG